MAEVKSMDVTRVWVEDNDGQYTAAYSYYSDLFAADLAASRQQSHKTPVYKTESMAPNERSMVDRTKVFRTNDAAGANANDMTSLAYLDEPNMLQCLETRYNQDNIYTSIAGVLVAINPFRNLGIYTSEWMRKFRGQRRLDVLPPHVFAVAERAYQDLTRNNVNQSMICCGESGSGKTESTKMLMRYLANVTQLHGDTQDTRVYSRSVVSDKAPGPSPPQSGPAPLSEATQALPEASLVERQVLEANPVLEAFGNARTLMNDNSSRFAKFTKLFFSEQGRIAGAHTETYLLEKSRVVSASKGERTFHIFYQICADEATRVELGLPDDGASAIKYLQRGGVMKLAGVSDADQLQETLKGMETMGIEKDDRQNALAITAAVACLGNVEFSDDEKTGGCTITPPSEKWLSLVVNLLKLDEAALRARLTSRSITIRGKETYQKKLNTEEAIINRDALAKTLYQELFHWVVFRINQTLYKDADQAAELNWIGVLDVFGFECFDHNSFEQFCINYANERLQQFFNIHIMKSEQAEYRKEGIFWVPVEIPDNSDVLWLINSKPSGILCLLDSACIMPKGAADTFHNNIFAVHKGHARLAKGSAIDQRRQAKKNSNRFSVMGGASSAVAKMVRGGGNVKTRQKPKKFLGFYIRHYAGQVLYDADQFLFKNSDSTHPDTIKLYSSSKLGLLHDLFAEQAAVLSTAAVANTAFHSVGSTFSRQLGSLMNTLMATTPYFIRCASPNNTQSANNYMWNYVKPQLKNGGLVEALRVLKFGYPSRVPYDEIGGKYADALKPRPVNLNMRNFCEAILVAFGLGRTEYQLGLTKVFFRPGKQEFLESIFRRSEEPLTPEIEAAIRKWLVKRRIQRACMTVRAFLVWKDRLQHIRRAHRFRKTVRRAVLYCQTIGAGLQRVRKLRGARDNAVTYLQAWWRHYSNRSKLIANLDRRVKQKRKNRFKFGGLDAKSQEELNMLRIQMKAAKRKEAAERKRLEDLRKDAIAKQMAAQKEVEERKKELERMATEYEAMKKKEEESKRIAKEMETLKERTERLKQEHKQAAQQAKLIVQQRELEYKRREDELKKMKEDAEKRKQEAEKTAMEIVKKKEQERRQKELEAQRLAAETEKLRKENELKAAEAKRLLEEREEANRKAAIELAKMQDEAVKLKQNTEQVTEELQMQMAAERRKKEEEAAQLQAEIEAMRTKVENEALRAKEALLAKQKENERKRQELKALQEEQERMRLEHEARTKALEEQRERERQEKQEQLALLAQEQKRTEELYKRQQEEAKQQLVQKEAENKKKAEMLAAMQEEQRKLREEQERKQREAAELLKQKEAEAAKQALEFQEQQKKAHQEFEEKQRLAEEMAQKELTEKLQQREQEAKSEVEKLEAKHKDKVTQLNLAIVEREEEIERLNEVADETARSHAAAIQKLRDQLNEQIALTAARDATIAAQLAEMARMKEAHEEVNNISQRLISETQHQLAEAKREHKEAYGKLSKAHKTLQENFAGLEKDHADLTSHFQKEMKAIEEERQKAPKQGLFKSQTFAYKNDSPLFVEDEKVDAEFDMPVVTRERKATDARPDLQAILQQNILSSKNKADFYAMFKNRGGWLQKRRPGNKLLGKAFKTRYHTVKGGVMAWYRDEPKTNSVEPLNTLLLADYLLIEYDEEEARKDPLGYEFALLPRQKGTKAVILQAAPAKIDKKTKYKQAGSSIDVVEWIEDLNTRIAVGAYLEEMFKTAKTKGCREVVEFVCDPIHRELRIENQAVELYPALVALKEPLAVRKNFHKIVLNNVALDDASLKIISEVLVRNNNIMEMELMHNPLVTHVGATHLANALTENKESHMRIIKLNYSTIGDDGAKALAGVIPVLSRFCRLSLTGNKITDVGAEAIAAAIAKGGALRKWPRIELGENMISDAGAKALAQTCGKNRGIIRIDLHNNLVSDVGVAALAAALKQRSCGLVDINLASNQITSKGVIALSDAMKATSGNLAVDLSNNKLITRTGVVSIVDADFALEFRQLKVVRGRGSKSIFVKRQNVEALVS